MTKSLTTTGGLNLSPKVRKRLQDKFLEKNDEEVLKILESIKQHRLEIQRLWKRAKELTTLDFIADVNSEETEYED